MRCPNCNLAISEKRKRCSRCGTPLRPGPIDTPGAERQVSAQQQELEEVSAVPEWRKELSQKVRAFGERKKYLTTPPSPIKEDTASEPNTSLSPRPETPNPSPAAEKKVSREPVFDQKPAQRTHPPANDPTPADAPPVHRSEISAQDYAGFILPELDQQADSATPPLLLARRTFALLVDNVLIVILWFAVLWFVSWLYDKNWEVYLEPLKLQWTGVFLLGHLLYYLYFYKTSRQTPGQVFFSLELRVPGLNTIPVGKIVMRWLAMVLLNIFNIVPLFLGKKFLLLDMLSGTEIRSLR